MKAEQPGDLGDLQIPLFEIANGEIAPQSVEYFSERQPFRSQAACKCSLAEIEKGGDGFELRLGVRQERRNGVLHDSSESAHLGRTVADRVLAGLQHQLMQEWVLSNDSHIEQWSVQTYLVGVYAKLNIAPKQLSNSPLVGCPVVDEPNRERQKPLTDE